jgi:hypothetical protein
MLDNIGAAIRADDAYVANLSRVEIERVQRRGLPAMTCLSRAWRDLTK